MFKNGHLPNNNLKVLKFWILQNYFDNVKMLDCQKNNFGILESWEIKNWPCPKSGTPLGHFCNIPPLFPTIRNITFVPTGAEPEGKATEKTQ